MNFHAQNRGSVMNVHKLFIGSLLVISSWVYASDMTSMVDEIQPTPPVSLSELASQADLVAVAQVKDTDYVYTRSFPSEGSAYLKILITYKMNRAGEDIIEVYDKGLHPNECYFENPIYPEEGRRYLVFLRVDPKDPETYRGLDQGCALEILVTEDSRYTLKYPLDGITLSDNLEELATEFQFRDAHAVVSEEALSPARRDELLKRELIKPYQEQYKYTHGIDLTSARKLIDAEALKTKQNWRN